MAIDARGRYPQARACSTAVRVVSPRLAIADRRVGVGEEIKALPLAGTLGSKHSTKRVSGNPGAIHS